MRTNSAEPREHAAVRIGAGGKPRTAQVQRLLAGAAVPSVEQLKAYWKKVGKRALPYLANRPLTLVRYERGQVFFHTGSLPPTPASVHRLTFDKREGGTGTRAWIDSVDGLIALCDIGTIEVHPWNATVDALECPDRMVFDLDPGEGIAWAYVTRAALRLRDVLKRQYGYRSWPKATGGKGLHIVVPLDGTRDHDAVRSLAKEIATDFAASDARLVVTSSLKARPGHLFVDTLRNGRGQTAVGAFSPRARGGFPVAAPLSWAQVTRGVRSDAFTISHLPRGR
jgi:bifunctional non-homologous end joining protein LigD